MGRIGSLSTHSRKLAGYPFGSMMPYAADRQGCPVFFISSVAMHSQNLIEDPDDSVSGVVTEVDSWTQKERM